MEYINSFEFEFVDPSQLTKEELRVYSLTDKILSLIGGKPSIVKAIKISETMRKDLNTSDDVRGVWDAKTRTIIVKRDRLSSIRDYDGTLLHEVAHAISGTRDVTREFEISLTTLIGIIVEAA